MGLIQRLRRSFRGGKPPKRAAVGKTSTSAGKSSTTTGTSPTNASSTKTAASATRSSTKSTAPSGPGTGAKPAPPPVVPSAGSAVAVTGASRIDGRAGYGCGDADSASARATRAGAGGAASVTSVGNAEKATGAGKAASVTRGDVCGVTGAGASESRPNTAEALVPVANGPAAGAVASVVVVADAVVADAATVQKLEAQVTEIQAELASLRAAVQSLESRVSKTLAPPRRLPRANSYQPGTQSLVTSSLSLEEGPNCVLKDDEFYDALAVSLMHLEQETEKRDELRKKKDDEMKEERRKKEDEESGTNKEGENDDQLKDSQATESEGKPQEVEDAVTSSTKTENQSSTTASKPPPPKPQRSLSKQSSLEHDVTDSGSIGSPELPLPPAAAPRGGCSGNCSQLGHPLAAEIERVVTEQLGLVSSDVSDGWTLFAQQGDMHMYRMELPADNRSVDPLKAVSKAAGVTARELCRAYWEPNERLDWETTVDRVTVLARPDPSTVICHQLHRRIWPAQQRDTVFWSHLCRRKVGDKEWSITVNHSISGHPSEPPANNGAVRATMTAALAGMDEEEVSGDRRKLRCHVAYSSHVNPGGWAPTTGLRLVYKREYPRFLQRFTKYVTEKSRARPVEA